MIVKYLQHMFYYWYSICELGIFLVWIPLIINYGINYVIGDRGLYFQKRVCEVQDIIKFVAQKKLRILHKHKDTKLLSVLSK